MPPGRWGSSNACGQYEGSDRLTGLIAPTRTGLCCMEYRLHQDDEDPAEFTFCANCPNLPEWEKHMQLSHLAKFPEVRDNVVEFQKRRLMTMIRCRDEPADIGSDLRIRGAEAIVRKGLDLPVGKDAAKPAHRCRDLQRRAIRCYVVLHLADPDAATRPDDTLVEAGQGQIRLNLHEGNQRNAEIPQDTLFGQTNSRSAIYAQPDRGDDFLQVSALHGPVLVSKWNLSTDYIRPVQRFGSFIPDRTFAQGVPGIDKQFDLFRHQRPSWIQVGRAIDPNYTHIKQEAVIQDNMSKTEASPMLYATADSLPGGEGLVTANVGAITRLIRSAELGPGDPLPSEANLSRDLNVSRTVIREAFRSLAAMHLIELSVGKRATVAELDYTALSPLIEHGVPTE